MAGCGRQPTTITSVALPSGWQSINRSGLTFALPPDWQVLSTEEGNFEGALDDLVASNPRIAPVAEQTRAALQSGQIKLLAFDLAPADALPNFTTNLSAGQQATTSTSLDEIAAANERQLTASGFTAVKRTSVATGTGAAARLTSTYTITGADGSPLQLALTQFIVLHASRQYIFTFTTTADQQGRMQRVFDQIMGTLQINAG
jgi:hypothetical protein